MVTTSSETCTETFETRPRRIVYIGDGANDACPVLNVLRRPNDVILARKGIKPSHLTNYGRCGPELDHVLEHTAAHDGEKSSGASSQFGILPALSKAADEEGLNPKCQVWEWSTGMELQKFILRLLDEIPAP